MAKFKEGDRFNDIILSIKGNIVSVIDSHIPALYEVVYDRSPPLEYNMGDKKSIQFEHNLEKEHGDK